uniref:Uncharacterized protein n=1 Tax=Anguilla anguilla TaxID=7936 RepID=A0A0E9XGN2_ANGAN
MVWKTTRRCLLKSFYFHICQTLQTHLNKSKKNK